MAKTSKLARNAQRKVLVERYAPKRAALKAVISSPKSTPEEVQAAVNALHKPPGHGPERPDSRRAQGELVILAAAPRFRGAVRRDQYERWAWRERLAG